MRLDKLKCVSGWAVLAVVALVAAQTGGSLDSNQELILKDESGRVRLRFSAAGSPRIEALNEEGGRLWRILGTSEGSRIELFGSDGQRKVVIAQDDREGQYFQLGARGKGSGELVQRVSGEELGVELWGSPSRRIALSVSSLYSEVRTVAPGGEVVWTSTAAGEVVGHLQSFNGNTLKFQASRDVREPAMVLYESSTGAGIEEWP